MAPPRIPVKDRFWTKVSKVDSCWTWLARRDCDGYGEIQVDGKKCRAHRVVWELTFGAIPSGLSVLHRCDNPSCVRPEHLFLGTNAANSADMVSKHRQARGAQQGLAKLTESEVLDIRGRYAAGSSTNRLSREFDVYPSNIWFIVSRTTWRHV